MIITKKGLKKENVLIKNNLVRFINDVCEIDEGVTVRQIMNLVAQNQELSTIVSIWAGVQGIDSFHKEVNKRGKKDDKIEYIEICHGGQIIDNKLELWTEWLGKGDKTYSLSYVPLNTIAQIPVKLNEELKVWNLDNRDTEPAIDYLRDFTLIEILYAIYYDISFHGSAEKRDAFKAELHETVRQLHAGEIKTYPMSDFDWNC